MKLMTTLVALFLGASHISATPFESIFSRAVGDSCKAPEGSGSCKNTKDCPGISYPTGLCPKYPNDVQCCVNIKCSVGSDSGYCRSVKNNGCSGGSFHANHCPGSSDIQCCIKDSATSPPPPSLSGSNLGEKILAKAREAKGLPYVWGGGSCSGPSGSGENGFDCSGLLSWAICKVTGRNLFSEGLRVTRNMYCASENTLKYKKVPYSQRRAGDAVFFGRSSTKDNCPCDHAHWEEIHHVGIMVNSGTKMFNALKTGTNIREDDFGSWSDKPCESVIRFE